MLKHYEKILELSGVGFRAALKGKQLNLQLGFSHDINFDIPEGIKIAVEKQTTLKITGSDKQLVGEVASKIKTLRKIEPYLRSFENIRIIHEFCASESEHYEIEVVDNEDFDETTNTLIQLIINTLQEQVNSTLPPKS